MIAFYVQGGGLGHLSRTTALIQQLGIPPKEVVIITPSAFTHYFKQYSFAAISWETAPEDWTAQICNLLTHYAVKQCYIDTFPLGLKGELIGVYTQLSTISFHYICRILQWENYLSAMPKAYTPRFASILRLENLYASHENWVQQASATIQPLTLNKPTPIPVALIPDDYVLLVHSGGKKDVLALCQQLKNNRKYPEIPVYVFTQVNPGFDDKQFHFRIKEYPVNQYFKHAKHIYTAAGFNLMNELRAYKAKHTAFPVKRLYDDQYFRIKNDKSST